MMCDKLVEIIVKVKKVKLFIEKDCKDIIMCFFEWMNDYNFMLMGYCYYWVNVIEGDY